MTLKLSDLAPGDVAVFFADDSHNRFVLTDDRRCQYADGSLIRVNGETEIHHIGRGRFVPPVAGRIAMNGEPDATLVANLNSDFRLVALRLAEAFAEEVRRIKAANAPPTWTDAKPTVPGVFLWRQRGETRPERWELVVVVPDERHSVVRQLAHDCGGWGKAWPLPNGQFAGPLSSPTEERR